MGKLAILISTLYISGVGYCQTASEIISKIKVAQQELGAAHYLVTRQDTFVTGTTRRITGEVKIKALPSDPFFGFAYWGRQDGADREAIYDGKSVYFIDHAKKSYKSYSSSSMIENSLGSIGGQVIVTELVRLDVTQAKRIDLKEDNKYYYLVLSLHDIKDYDVINRIRTITVDKKLMLPVAVRSRQETLGKVQDIYYEITELKLNNEAIAYDFSSERIPQGYTRETNIINKKLSSLKGNRMPVFALNDFDNNLVKSEDMKGKLVLLDFWEVWCGPCIASMPKVQDLEKKYADKGFAVLGLISEKEQLEVAKQIVSKRQLSFPMLQGDKSVNNIFGVSAVPTYILVDREGIVRFTSEGYSDQLEKEIQRLL